MKAPLTIPYAVHPTKKGPRELLADLWLPEGGPFELLVWMHSGGFRVGSRTHRNHPAIAREFARHGIATAFIDYRLSRPIPILSPQSAAALPHLLAEAAESDMHPSFLGHRPLAVVEDACAFLRFAEERRAAWRIQGPVLLGGSSAGAISALNTLWLPPVLGLDRPPVATVFAFSGAFGYPSLRRKTGARILALHSPLDARVPATSLRQMAMAPEPDDDHLLYIESEQHAHGEVCLSPDETLEAAVMRCVSFHRAPDDGLAGQNREVPCSTIPA